MTNSLTVVAKVFSNTCTWIFFMQKCEQLLQCKSYSFFQQKISRTNFHGPKDVRALQVRLHYFSEEIRYGSHVNCLPSR